MHRYLTAIGALLLVAGCASDQQSPAGETPPIYDNTAGLVFDIIKVGDKSSFVCLHDRGRAKRQMWDKRIDAEIYPQVFLFDAYFSDGIRFEVNVNPEFGTADAAATEAFRYLKGLGQLPTILRRGIKRFGIHDGEETASAGAGKIFVYRENAIYRQSYNHLEETLFHESVHASLDDEHMRHADWRAAQDADGRFLTGYARDRYPREDMAETALLAYGVLRYRDRVPPVDTRAVKKAVPNRLAYLKQILPVRGPVFEVPAEGAFTLADAPEGCMTQPPT